MSNTRTPRTVKGRVKNLEKTGKVSRSEALALEDMLYGGRVASNAVYDPEVHPAGMLEYFQNAYKKLKDAERNVDAKGTLKFVGKPIKPPTIAGYAVIAGVRRETLWVWTKMHPEFEDALERCRAIQEAFFLEASMIGAANPQVAIFALKNHHGYSEKAEVRTGAVEIHIDEQDADA